MRTLESTIDNLYNTFSKYTTEGMHHCNCGCIKEENLIKLHSKPLRQLEEDDLISYHGSALYTWGDVQHYKHYLPRICELVSKHEDFRFIGIDELHAKLDYAKWTEWPINEQRAINDFVIENWVDLINNNYPNIRDSQLADYAKFFDIETLISLWKVNSSDFALRNFVYFFYYHGTQILNDGLKIENKVLGKEFIQLFESGDILKKLESNFFKNEKADSEYADKISIVLQMIEQEQKIKNSR
jgi:hypothetical protein